MAIRLRFGDLGRTSGLTNWGSQRGQPVDRWYIERFLDAHSIAVRGRALEVKSDLYASSLGASKVDVIDIEADNELATIIGDLCDESTLPTASYDVAIITQTLQLVPDPVGALRNIFASLRPGGALLLTVPCLSRVATPTDSWRWTPIGARRLIDATAPAGSMVEVQGLGNALAGRAFLFGLAADDLDPSVMAVGDPDHPLLVGVLVQLPA